MPRSALNGKRRTPSVAERRHPFAIVKRRADCVCKDNKRQRFGGPVASVGILMGVEALGPEAKVNDPTAGGLQLTVAGRRVRLVDGSPARSIASSDGVGGGSEPTADAPKMRWVGAVAPVAEPALRAGPRGVAGIHKHDRNSRKTRLVLKARS